jgi:hypothetical protein
VIDNAGRLTGVLDISAATHALVEIERGESAARVFQTVGGRRRSGILSSMAVGLALAVVAAAFYGVLRRAAGVTYFIPAILAAAAAAVTWAVAMSVDSVQLIRKPVLPQNFWSPLAFGAAGSAVAGLFVSVWLKMPPLALAVACWPRRRCCSEPRPRSASYN